MHAVMDALKAMGDENRLRILLALRDGELCVCQLIDLLGLAPSTVSKHLSILRSARLVESRKDGRWIYYQLSDKKRFPMQAEFFCMAAKSASKSPQAVSDKKALTKIRNADMEKLCRKLLKKN